MPKMKAAIRRSYTSPDHINIEDIEKPLPKENELLIKVFATTVNRTDCANLSAKPFIMRFFLGLFKPRKMILGTDFAGEVSSLGNNVKSFNIGDRVFGFDDSGSESQAEYLILPENGNILAIPSNIDYPSAASSIEGAHYAYSFTHKVNILAGQRILINGATGAIGSALLQLVKQYDVHITATSDTKNMDLIKSLGADIVIDYTKEDFTKVDEKYDFIFDAVGKSTFGKCKPILRKKGVYISSELGPYAQNIFYALITSVAGHKKVIFPIPFSIKKTMPYILNLLKNGKYQPIIDRSYALQDISNAYLYVQSGKKTGNVIINIK